MNRNYSRCGSGRYAGAMTLGGYGNSQSRAHNAWIPYFEEVMRGEKTMPEARQEYRDATFLALKKQGLTEVQIEEYFREQDQRALIAKQRKDARKGIREAMRGERLVIRGEREVARNANPNNRLRRGQHPLPKYAKDYRHRLLYGTPSGRFHPPMAPRQLLRAPNFRIRGQPKRPPTRYEEGRRGIVDQYRAFRSAPPSPEGPFPDEYKDGAYQSPSPFAEGEYDFIPVGPQGEHPDLERFRAQLYDEAINGPPVVPQVRRPRNPKSGFRAINVINPKTGLPFQRVSRKARVLSPQDLEDIGEL